MPFVPTPGIAQASIFWLSNDNVVAENRIFCAVATVPTESDLEEIGDALYDVIVAQLIPNTSVSWKLTGIRVRAMNEAEGLVFDDTNSYPVDGGAADAVAPPSQVAYTVTLNTGLVGRSARGRIYGVGMPPVYQQGVRLTDAGQGALQSVWELIFDAMVTAGHSINVVSFIEGGVPRAEGRALPATSVSVRFPLATQRRRLS
jgi:hypothetical protein